MKARHWAIILFLGLGIAKLPLEQHSTTTLRSAGALNAPTDLGLRENLGQMSFAASLGGLRSLVASITYLQAFAAFENVDWGKVDSLMTLTTRLQPNFGVYWDDAASRMGYDAASYYRYDESRPTLYRNRLYREHVARGIEILNEGLQRLPNDSKLHQRLGEFYARRLEPPDHVKAGEHFLLCSQNGGLKVYERMAAYEWAKVEDRPTQKRAYDILRSSYLRGLKLPSVIITLKALEKSLQIPPWQHIPETSAPVD
jgi:hypothetical protein